MIPPTIPKLRPEGKEKKKKEAAANLLETVDFSVTNIKEWAILDSGATSHFLVVDAPKEDVRIANTPISIRQPDGASVQSTHTCALKIAKLPGPA